MGAIGDCISISASIRILPSSQPMGCSSTSASSFRPAVGKPPAQKQAVQFLYEYTNNLRYQSERLRERPTAIRVA